MWTIGQVRNRLLVPLLIVLTIALLKTFFFDYYQVPSESMVPLIMPGDLIFVSKIAYESKTHQVTQNLISFNVKRDEIWVFVKPDYQSGSPHTSAHSIDFYIKRCIGLPGDKIFIDRPSLSSLSGYPSKLKDTVNNLNVFPHSTYFHWNLNKFGPLWVPKKGTTIALTPKNVILYEGLIRYEGNTFEADTSQIKVNHIKTSHYRFKNNYYFMIGDNFYDSEDSRIWGLVPEGNLRAKFLFSF